MLTDLCPYVQMDPQSEFGMWNGEELEYVGTCGENGYFNDTFDVCTCTVMYGEYKMTNVHCTQTQ